MRLIFILILALFSSNLYAKPIISGISTNEININSKFRGTDILLFGAKGSAGNIVIVVRGPKKNFIVTKKQKSLGIWYNGERITFEKSPTYYYLFSTCNDNQIDEKLLQELELGVNNLKLDVNENIEKEVRDEFKLQLINKLEKESLYSDINNKIEFLDETLFKVILHFPKNISQGIYNVEIYLISENNLISFQSIPIYVNQVGLSGKVSNFAYNQSLLYAIIAVLVALIIGWLANYLFARFFIK